MTVRTNIAAPQIAAIHGFIVAQPGRWRDAVRRDTGLRDAYNGYTSAPFSASARAALVLNFTRVFPNVSLPE
jgi:hypothetical protein